MKEGIKIQVRFSDIDVMGHVSNAVYLSYFEIARVIFFSKLLGENWDWKKDGVLLRKNEIEYIKPVLLNEVPEIFIYTQKVGKKSFTLEYDLVVNNEIRTTGSSVLVAFDSELNISKEIPSKMKGVLNQLFRNGN
jgi:acyl-CoA thioester hydrolase